MICLSMTRLFNLTQPILIIALLLSTLATATAQSQADSLDSHYAQRAYTEEQPLIYEGAQDLWPYSFLDDNGNPDGYNIDLMKLVLGKLKIPYTIKMKPRMVAYRDLKAGRSDLMIGLTAGFHEKYGYYSESSVTLFTQSILSPKSNPTKVSDFHDLATHRVYVNDSSLCHHLMVDYGWSKNAIPIRNMAETVKQISTDEEGELVWNTLSLKWLLRQFQIDNLEITPVDMPHGEYKFMSGDKRLIERLDSVFSELNSSDQLLPLQNKWFYPERQEKRTPVWVWYAATIVGLLLLFLIIYTIAYQLQAARINRENARDNRQLALILETSGVSIWTYNIRSSLFAWRNEKGQVAYTFSKDEFAQRYPASDFARLLETIDELAANQLKEGEEEPERTLMMKAFGTEEGKARMRIILETISVLQRNKAGLPTELMGTRVDVTRQHQQQQLAKERALRYWTIFKTDIVGIMFFNEHGILTEANQKACDLYCCDHDEIVSAQLPLSDIFDIEHLPFEQMDGYHATQFIDLDKLPADKRRVPAIKRKGVLCNEFYLMTVRDDHNSAIGIFAVCRDVTHVRENQHCQREKARTLQQLKSILAKYDHDIDRVLHESDVRLASYSPDSHVLSIFRSANEQQHALTQTRCMTLVDDRSKKIAMRLLAQMDDREDRDVQANIYTTLRIKGGLRLSLQFCLTPLKDKNGQIVSYLGLCRDFSELRHIEQQLSVENAKVQEVENAKSSFVKNMVQDIKQPMSTVMDYVARLNPNAPNPDEEQLSNGILDNADYLLHLINDILFLSRLEAHMVEIKCKPCNFADVFHAHCETGWQKYKNSATQYIVENPYEVLMVDIDCENLGHVIRQLTGNAAKHTHSGTIRTRCEFIGRRLVISVDDTGMGIPADELARLNQPATANQSHTTKGLGLSICRELVSQMNGTFEIISEKGAGTTIYVSIPCHASIIKRKRN